MKMNFVDKVISFFNPESAYERAVYREALRNYDAGKVNRFNSDWLPVNTDTENADKNERDIIKARARHLERNSDLGNSAIGGMQRNIIGDGIKPQAKTADNNLNRQLEELWKTWSQANNCDITAQQSFYELQALVFNRMWIDGEIFIRLVIDNKSEATLPLKLQVLKSDWIDATICTAPKTGNIIRSGIELSSALKPLAYWVQKRSADGYIQLDSERIPANQILHLWQKKLPDQIRGISNMATIINRIKDTQDYLNAELVSAKIAACFSIFIKKNAPHGAVGRMEVDKEGKRLFDLAPGLITELQPGEDISTANPSRTMTNAKDFMGIQERLIGAGVGLSYELMSRDFQKSSFSAARQGHLEDRKTFKPLQNYIVGHFCQPIWEQFVDLAVLTGLVYIPNYFTNRNQYIKAEWITPGWSWIDPVKEVTADISALKNGGKTMSQWCAERGFDWQEQLEQVAKEKDYAESLGLTLGIHTPEAVQAAATNFNNQSKEEED